MTTTNAQNNAELITTDHSVAGPAIDSTNETRVARVVPRFINETGTTGVAAVPEMESVPGALTEVIRAVIRNGGRSLVDLSGATGIPKATLSRFMNSKGSLQSGKLDALAVALDLTLVRHVSLADRIDRLMESKAAHAWFCEACDRVGISRKHGSQIKRFGHVVRASDDNEQTRQKWNTIHEDTTARAEWESGFRAELTSQERDRLQAIDWIVLDDDMPSEPSASQEVTK